MVGLLAAIVHRLEYHPGIGFRTQAVDHDLHLVRNLAIQCLQPQSVVFAHFRLIVLKIVPEVRTSTIKILMGLNLRALDVLAVDLQHVVGEEILVKGDRGRRSAPAYRQVRI